MIAAVRAKPMLTYCGNEPFIADIADRLRGLLMGGTHPHDSKLNRAAQELGVSASQIEALLNDRPALIDVGLLIDLVVVVVRDQAVDPRWLLTGEYDVATHQAALAVAEETSSRSAVESEIRSIVRHQWRLQQERLTPDLQFSFAS